MSVLIDGFNLLRGIQYWGPIDSLGQLQLCELLSRWAEVSGESVLIIFDGPLPPSGYAEQLRLTGIQVQHSGVQRSADDCIIEEINCCSNPRHLTVVSSDRRIRAATRRRRGRDVKSRDFFKQLWKELQQAEASKEEPREPEAKHEGLSTEETERWLREFKLFEEKDDRF
jgi:predicted RNA-binding protein with PIN domain